jgi:ATP-dependent RNA helicase DDX27
VEAHRIKLVLTAAGIRAGELHGNLNQAQRLQSLQGFKDGVVDVLVCTDVAARGLDITGVQCVINTEMPRNRYARLTGNRAG